jgi:hypothetical protein
MVYIGYHYFGFIPHYSNVILLNNSFEQSFIPAELKNLNYILVGILYNTHLIYIRF